MRIARYSLGESIGWGLVHVDAGNITPIQGVFASWAPALTRAIAAGKAAAGRSRQNRQIPERDAARRHQL